MSQVPPRAALDRRALLRGVLTGSAVALGLPWLEGMTGRGTARASTDGAFPKRFVLFNWGNGNVPEQWTPAAEGVDWVPSPELEPLTALKPKISVVTGYAVKLPNVYPHGSGAAGILSGAQLANEDLRSFTAPSIDQVIAEAIGHDTLYASLQTAGSNNLGLSFAGPNALLPAESDPFLVFERMFGNTFVVPGSGGLVDPRLGLRRSVLDVVMGDLTTLRGRVGAADRARLDQHFDGLRALEQRLAKLEEDPPELDACELPAEPLREYPDIEGRPQFDARNKAMAELVAMALACDQTRVAAHYLTEPVHNLLFPDATAGHHNLTHDEPGDQPQVQAISKLCVGHYADFVAALEAIPEGDGTLLDHSLVFGCTEISRGRTHSLDEMPLLIAGSCCGALKTGLHVRSATRENATSVLLTMFRALDVNMSTYGVDEAEASASVSALEA